MTTEHTILYTVDDAIATITLNRPHVYNAFSEPMPAELVAALDMAERDDGVRCVVITGAGKAFCSGQDIKDAPADGSRSLGVSVRERYNPLVRKLRSLPKPVVAAVNGVAAGAGMGLALACDLRVAVDTARFVVAFAKIGLAMDTGVSYFLPRLIGHARALELCMLGDEIDAPTAARYGMVQVVASAEAFPAAVRHLAERLARGSPTALRLIKHGFNLSPDATLEEMLEYEAEAQQIAGVSSEYIEGLRAFREKRPPHFR